jgi:hypothetical protein
MAGGKELVDLTAELEAMGHVISHKWFAVEAAYMQDAPLHARLDLNGVRNCTAFVALFDADFPFLNAYVELGMALALDKAVFIVGMADKNCLFTRLEEPDASIERFDGVDSFLAFMRSRD